MTLPLTPSVETILRSSIETLKTAIVPELTSEWGRYSGHLLSAALEYAITQLREDRQARHRSELAEALEALRPAIANSGDEELAAALDEPSPFEAASRLLVAGQRSPGLPADEVRAGLRPLLLRQLDEEFAAGLPLLMAFAPHEVHDHADRPVVLGTPDERALVLQLEKLLLHVGIERVDVDFLVVLDRHCGLSCADR